MIDAFKVLGDEIVAKLRAATFSTAPESITRRNRVLPEAEKHSHLRIYVLPNIRGFLDATRQQWDAQYGFRVGVFQRIDKPKEAEFESYVDALNKLMDEVIHELLQHRVLLNRAALLQLGEAAPEEVFDEAEMASQRFWSAITVVYQEIAE